MLRSFIKKNYANVTCREVAKDLFEKYQIHSHIVDDRIILYTNKFNNQYEDFIPSIEANGIVFDFNWDVKCMPAFNYNMNISIAKLSKMIYENEYHIFMTKDSTVVNLYYDKDAWCIGTCKGIDVSKVKYNSMTYLDMFNDCLFNEFVDSTINEEDLELDDSQFLLKMEKDNFNNNKTNILKKFWSSLNKHYTYTMGFRHPNMHIFQNDNIEEKVIYFIQQVNTEPINAITIQRDVTVTDDADNSVSGLISELGIKVEELNDIDIPYQCKISISLHDMLMNCKNAYQNYIDTNRKCKPVFGYMLRRNFIDGVVNENQIIYIESSLMKNIRRVLYNISQNIKLAKYEQSKAMILNNYLNSGYRDIVCYLFPQLNDHFYKFDLIINMIVTNIIVYKPGMLIETKLNQITEKFYNDCKDIIEISKTNFSKIKDIILNANNLEILYEVVYSV